MRNILLGGVVIVAAAALGCQPQNKPAQTSSARPTALDVTTPTASATPTYQPAPASVTPPSEPSVSQTPVTYASTSGGGNYTVKKGDTLYRIAKDKYGDGKQWQKIASANPGLSPSSLKVGQSIIIPQ